MKSTERLLISEAVDIASKQFQGQAKRAGHPEVKKIYETRVAEFVMLRQRLADAAFCKVDEK